MSDGQCVGFLEQSPGNKSSTRLIAVWLTGLATVLVGTIVFYVVYSLTRKPALPLDQYIILALVAGLTAVVLNGAVAIINRTPSPS